MKQALVLRNFLVSLILVLFYGPLIFMVAKAFVNQDQFSFIWFEELFSDPSFWESLKNSFLIAFVSSVFSVSLGLLAVLMKRSSVFFDRLMLLSLSFPEIVLALSSLSLFVLVKWPLGLSTMIIGHTTLTLSFAYFILDLTLIEAAKDLGASPQVIRNRIQLPWLKSSILGSFFLCFLLSFDDFLISFFVSGIGQSTLPVKLFSMLKIGISPKVNALSFLILSFSFLTIVLFFPLLKILRKK